MGFMKYVKVKCRTKIPQSLAGEKGKYTVIYLFSHVSSLSLRTTFLWSQH